MHVCGHTVVLGGLAGCPAGCHSTGPAAKSAPRPPALSLLPRPAADFVLGPPVRLRTPHAQIVADVRANAQRREQGLRTQLAEKDKQIATMQDMLGTSKQSKLFKGGDRAFMDDLLLTVLEQKDALADELHSLSNEFLKLKARLGMSEFEKEKLEAESRAQKRRSAGSIGSAGSLSSLRQNSDETPGAAPAASTGRIFGSAPSLISSFRQTSDPGPGPRSSAPVVGRLRSGDSSRPDRESFDTVFDVANSRSMSLASVGEVDATMTEEVVSQLASLEERDAMASQLAEAEQTIQELGAQLEVQSRNSSRQGSRQRRKQVRTADEPVPNGCCIVEPPSLLTTTRVVYASSATG